MAFHQMMIEVRILDDRLLKKVSTERQEL